MSSRIVNIDEVPFEDWAHGERYEARIAGVGRALGSEKLGFNVTVLPPGKCAFPLHAHHANEEMFFVLEGRGRVRIGETSHGIRAGDFISLPPGRDSAHQMVNDSDAPLRYLAVSTMETPEIAEYPESGKLGLFAGRPPVTRTAKDTVFHFARLADGVGYWDGEA